MRSNAILCLLFSLLTALSAAAAESPTTGQFRLVNTGGFEETGAERRALAAEAHEADVSVSAPAAGELLLTIGGTDIRLFQVEGGLGAVTWDARDTRLLHEADILALGGQTDMGDVPAWGARLDWPGAGPTTLILIAMGPEVYHGFLVSNPGAKRVVRQMELRLSYGPTGRN